MNEIYPENEYFPELREELDSLRSKTLFWGEKIEPINLFQGFCENFSTLEIERSNKLKTPFIIENKKIIIGRSFRIKDIPKLIQKIGKNEELNTFLETISQHYENRSKEINTMLQNEIWDANDTITKDAKKIWSRRAYFYFALSLVYKGEDVFDKERIKPKIRTKYKETIKKTALNNEFERVNAKLKLAQKTNKKLQEGKNKITQEFLEYYVSDQEEFSVRDLEIFLEELKNPFNLFSNYDEENIKKEQIKTFENIQKIITQTNLAKIILEIQKTPENKEKFENTLISFFKKLDNELKKQNRKELQITESADARNIYQILENDFTNTFLEQGRKNIVEKSNLTQEVKQKFTHKDFLEEFCKTKFTQEWDEIKKAQEARKKARNKNNISLATEIEKEIIKRVSIILSQKEFWNYKKNTYAPQSIIKQEGNCIVWGEMGNMILNDIFGIKTLGAITENHFFTLAQCSDGSYYSFETPPQKYKINPNKKLQKNGNEWIHIGNYNTQIKTAIRSWEVDKNKSPAKRLFLLKQSLDESPDNPSILSRYIQAILDSDFTNKQTIEIAKRLITLAPESMFYHYLYARTLQKNNRTLEGLKYLKKQEQINHKNPDTKLFLGFYYENEMYQPEKAQEYYKKAVKILINSPEKKCFWEKEKIQSKIN